MLRLSAYFRDIPVAWVIHGRSGLVFTVTRYLVLMTLYLRNSTFLAFCCFIHKKARRQTSALFGCLVQNVYWYAHLDTMITKPTRWTWALSRYFCVQQSPPGHTVLGTELNIGTRDKKWQHTPNRKKATAVYVYYFALRKFAYSEKG